ncbi:hypothetical protein [Halorussus salinus]|uniref:hypothetical protein n=1 Tax=Halorussus salinus TaxID=1364935 RepID=UPI001091AD27|nr:hypothetical protein [Halorussus salinus]
MSRPQNSPNSNPPSGPLGSRRPDEQETLHERLRRVLDTAETPISVSRLAERLHATHGDRGYAEVHDALYRTHLQRLDAAGLLVFDMEMGLVYDRDPSPDDRRDGCSA